MSAPSHILLVEDDPQISELLTLWVTQDWPTSTMQRVPTVATAIEALQTQPVDMLLVDLTLPNGEGLQVIDALIGAMPHEKPSLPNVIITGADKADMELLRHGGGEWVGKADALTLRQRINEAIAAEWARYRYRLSLLDRLRKASDE